MPAVLLIDDNLAQLCIREVVQRAAGVSAACASKAVEAFAFLQPVATKVDVIVTDHVMPGVQWLPCSFVGCTTCGRKWPLS